MPCGGQWRRTLRSPASSSSATTCPASSSPWPRGAPSSASSPCMGASWTAACSTSAKARSRQLCTLPACGWHGCKPWPRQGLGFLSQQGTWAAAHVANIFCSEGTTAINHHLQQTAKGMLSLLACNFGYLRVSTAVRIQSSCLGVWTMRCFTIGSCQRGPQQLEVLHACFAAHLQASARATKAPAHSPLEASSKCKLQRFAQAGR